MVTLQAIDSSNDKNEHYNWQKDIPLENTTQIENSLFNTESIDETNNICAISDNLTLPTYQNTVDYSSPHCNSVDDGTVDSMEVIAIEDDEDDDDDDDEVEEEMTEDVSHMVEWMQKIQHETSNGQILPSLDNSTFGEVSVTNSTNVRVGNTMLYKGPVTIKQFVCTNPNLTNENASAVTNGHIHDSNFNSTPIVKGNGNIVSDNPDYNKVKKWLWTWRCAAILCILGLILITVIVVLTVMLTPHLEFSPNFSPAIDPDDILVDSVRFIQRVEWGAQPPEAPPNHLNITPVPYVIISHTASEACNTQAECIQRVRLAQTMHIEGNKWSDIGYNFLVGGDGLVYVGRGWDSEGAHAFGFNSKSLGISLIGTFNKMVPPARQINALAKLIAIGMKKEKIRTDYKLLGHRQVSETVSPGNVLYGIIQQWDHWSEKP